MFVKKWFLIYLPSILARQSRGAHNTRLSLKEWIKSHPFTKHIDKTVPAIVKVFKVRNHYKVYTFSPFGAWPGDSPGSPFCPWNKKKQNRKHILFQTFGDTSPGRNDLGSSELRVSATFTLSKPRELILFLTGVDWLCLLKRAIRLGPPVTRFPESLQGGMGSDCVHSSPFSGSGNPVRAVWASIRCLIFLVKEQPSNLSAQLQCKSSKEKRGCFLC